MFRLVGLWVLSLATLFGAASAAAQQPIVLKLSHFLAAIIHGLEAALV